MDPMPRPDTEQPEGSSNSLADEALGAIGRPAAPAPEAPAEAPAEGTTPETPAEAAVPPTQGGGSGRRKAGIVGIVIALLAIPGAKFLLPLLAGGALSAALGGLFGGPFDRLPSDVKAAYEARVEAILPSGYDDWTDTAQTAWFESAFAGGTVRLDDLALVKRIELQTTALGRADAALCAAFAKEDPVSDTTAEKLIGLLEGQELIEWYGIGIQAIEADVAGATVPHLVTDAEAGAMLRKVLDAATPAETTALEALFAGSADDATGCAAYRALYGGIVRLGPADLAIAARLDVQP